MKSFFIKKQLKSCNKTTPGLPGLFTAGLKNYLVLFFAFFISSHVNAQTDGDPADWQSIITNSQYVKINDPRMDKFNLKTDEALGSGAKDVNDFPLWHWSTITNDKTDIQTAVLVLLTGNRVRFAADRFAQNGDAEIGIWLLKGPLSANADGTFTGQHTNGDVLISSKFTNGGVKPTISVRTWQNGALSSATVPPSGDADVNFTEKNVPGVFQPFQAKFGDPNKYPANAFFEGELDLDDILQGQPACFTRFLFETSQSQSNNEALGDFLLGSFNTKPNAPTVTNAEKCYDGTAASATASCGSNNGTLVFYDAVTGGNVVANPSRTNVGLSTFYAACNDNGCESDRVAVTVTINPVPTVNGLVSEGENDNSVNDGVTKNSDDNYTMRISKTLTASLTASAASGTAPYTYTWEELDADALTSLAPLTSTSSGNATFTITTLAGLRDAYRFKVTVIDAKGCTSSDELVINIDGSAPVCVINGADPVCAGSQNNIYTTSTPLNADFTYTWSISSTNGSTIDGGSPQAGQISQVSVDAGATAGSYTLTLSIVSGTGLVAANSPCAKTVQVKLVAPTSSKTDVVCNGQSNGTMTAVGAGGTAPYSYSISPAGDPPNTTGATTGAFTGLAAGTYTITATDVNNCSGTTTQIIGQPDALSCALITPATLVCGSSGTVTGTITGGTAGYSCSASFDAAGVAGGWSVTSCSVTGSGITVSYTSGLSATSTVLTVTVTDANGCTSTCFITVQCTGGQSCSPGFWRNQTQYWDGQGDVAVNNMPGILTNPVTPGGTFVASTNFWAYFNIPVNQAGLSTNANLTMAQAMVNTNISNVGCKSLVFHGIANLLSASLLPNTYPFPAGSNGNFTGLYTQIRNAFVANDCGTLGTTLGAISALHSGTYCQDAANAINSIVSRELGVPVDDDGGLDVSAYPNPYGNVVNFKFVSPTTGKGVLDVYDIVGRKLATVYRGEVKANVPISAKYNVPTLSRVTLFYKLTVDNKSVRGSVIPEK